MNVEWENMVVSFANLQIASSEVQERYQWSETPLIVDPHGSEGSPTARSISASIREYGLYDGRPSEPLEVSLGDVVQLQQCIQYLSDPVDVDCKKYPAPVSLSVESHPYIFPYRRY